MSIVKVTLPIGELPVNGKQITFTAPCSSADTEALQIEGVNYTVVDALCNCVTGSGGRWQAGAVVSVILDTVNQYAYIQNGNYTADQVTVTAATASALGLNNGASVDNALAKLSNAAFIQRKFQKVTDASQLPVGSTIKLNVDSTPTEFIVVHQGNPDPALYDASCDGTWLLMKNVESDNYWGSTYKDYADNTADNYLNDTFYPKFDDAVKSLIQTVKIPYGVGAPVTSIASGANGHETKAFLLADAEIGRTGVVTDDCGACLDYFADGDAEKRKGYYSSGSAANWWIRTASPSSGNMALYISGSNATEVYDTTTTKRGIRPAVIIKGDTSGFGFYTDGEELTEDETLAAQVALFDALGNPAELGVKIETGSYAGAGTYGAGKPNSLTFSFVPKIVFLLPYVDHSSKFGQSSWSGGSKPLAVMVENGMIHASQEAISSYGYSHIKWTGSTVQWECKTAALQLNESGTEYRYIAIG